MSQIGEWGTALSVLVLCVALLLLASLHYRREIHAAAMRAAVGRIEGPLSQIVDALDALRGVGLSRELRVTLRAEVLARYRRIARLYRRYPAIRQRIAEAEYALRAEGEPLPGGVGRIDGEAAFRRLSGSLAALMHLVGHERTLQPIPADVRAIFHRELGERRAEVWARFHLVAAARCRRSGNPTRARTHLGALMHGLRRNGPRTPFVDALYREAERAMLQLAEDALGPDPTALDRQAGTAIAPRAPFAGVLSV